MRVSSKTVAVAALGAFAFALAPVTGCVEAIPDALSADGGADAVADGDGAPSDVDRPPVDASSDRSEGSDGASDADGSLPPDERLGDGHRGPVTIDGAKKVINVYAAVVAAAKAGATTLTVSTGAGFVAGDLVLVVQTAGLSPEPASGDGTPIDLQTGAMGRWEMVRLAGIAGTQLALGTPLANDVAASGVQVVAVPEFTDVTIPAGTSLTAAPWDGKVGGILAFFATGAVSNLGGIDVSALGFRAGVFVRGGAGPCTAFDLPPPSGGQKGEGIATSGFGDAIGGYGNVANAAGGGNCAQSGGGGGGNGGPGGKGGAVDSNDRGGRGGVPLIFDPTTRLAPGGGGGAGQGVGALGTGGGHGGGVVLVHARSLVGAGYVRANGESAAQASGDSGGDAAAGGGGAGGTVHLRVVESLQCSGVEASGGDGGSSNGPNDVSAAPGGGGGGGRVILQAASIACPGGAVAGVAGVGKDGVSHQGAEPASASDPAYVGTVDIVTTGF
jgi:hypothetical protein